MPSSYSTVFKPHNMKSVVLEKRWEPGDSLMRRDDVSS